MAKLIGGALLSAFLEPVLNWLISDQIGELFRGNKLVLELLDELKIRLITANKLLNDAEEKQITDENVRKWLDNLKDIVYQADDLIDAIDTKALCRKLKAETTRCGNSKVLKELAHLNLSDGFGTSVKNKAAEILRRLKILLEQKDALGLREGIQHNLTSQRPFAPLAEESSVFGREGDKDDIINLLMSNDGSDGDISVVPIVGMGGIGKTTLAQLVYDDDLVKKHFKVRAWVTVSYEFDVLKITTSLFKKVTSEKYEKTKGETLLGRATSKHFQMTKGETLVQRVTSKKYEMTEGDLHELQRKLKEALKDKRFLFVLDDVWDVNYNRWASLRGFFGSEAEGSKIIVTTRNMAVVSVMADGPSHRPSDLSSENCWQLFTRHAFRNSADLCAHQDLQVIGREIVNKCKGLPLAIKSLGGLLRSERDIKKWENILKSDLWDELYKKASDILPALWLSYRYMPTHLKRCFSYCSIFPKDYQFERKRIILLWMAEGFLHSNKQGMTMEELGEEYFEDLLSRSLFQKSTQDESILIMHDLIHDLAMFVSGGFCSMLDHGNEKHDLPSQTRYFSYSREVQNFEGICKATCLRSFVQLPLFVENKYDDNTCPLPHKSLLTSGVCLRVLCLRGSSIKKLPSSIGNLIHLRYLDLSYSEVNHLPNSVCNLLNLQTLLLSWCENLEVLPKDMERLVKLRHLDIERVPLKDMPLQIYRLKSLQSLSKIVVGHGNRGPKISMCKRFQPFIGTLEISSIENVAFPAEAMEAGLKDNKGITSLSLRWSSRSPSSEKEREVLDSLQPHTSLKKLTIEFYRGSTFSDWVAHDYFCSVVSVELENCKGCRILPPLGQLPSLKKLKIVGFDSVVRVGDEFCGNGSSFRCLEMLWIDCMTEWEEWLLGEDVLEGKVFPRLIDLRLHFCPKLKISFPGHILSGRNPRMAFPSLTDVSLLICIELDSLLELLPCSNIKEVVMLHCPKLYRGYDMSGFSSLRDLQFSDWECDSFPPDEFLPESLITVRIWKCDKLVALNGKALQRLSSLEYMKIQKCTKLRCLPEEGLPSSLSTLLILDCPLLTKRCKKDVGKDWPKIAHIQNVAFEL